MKTTILIISIILIQLTQNLSFGQPLKPGFDKAEYKELMLISARTTGDTSYIKQFAEPANFTMTYQSTPIGLDNSWDLWTNNQKMVVISLRGTTQKAESWLANFYSAMVPATGSLKIDGSYTFHYELAQNPRAAVHVGWLLSLAYLSREILPKIDSCYATGVRDFLLIGHSQGGGINFLLTSHLLNLQSKNMIPKDIRFKTYCSAGPKPGNLYYAYEFEAATHAGWAYNVVNTADWVPEVPISIQTLHDFNAVNPFSHADAIIKSQKFPKNIAARHIFNKLDKPTRKAQRNYEKYLGEMTSKMITKQLPEFSPPKYVSSNHYARTGNTIVLYADSAYYTKFPDQNDKIFCHHVHDAYLFLLDKYEPGK